MYPEIINSSPSEAKEILHNITQSYLYKDILIFQKIKSPEVLEKLLQALALQVGSEVSYNELSQLIGIDKNTVSSYIQILEKAFIVFRLPPLSRNIRNEIKKLRKVYFYDNGIRNAIIKNLNPLELRNDTGALWENFLISERMKKNHYESKHLNRYFWRTHTQQEIDYIEDMNGKQSGFEFKWQNKKYKTPKAFTDNYPSSPVKCINKENFTTFL